MGEHTRLPETVRSKAKELKEERGFATLGEAVRHMCREGDYNV